MLFLETKMRADRPDKERYQLRCLAQIRAYLGCRAEIVYLREEKQLYQPKTYWVEIDDPAVPGPPPAASSPC